ncbi:hypothetical protein PR048_030216 [Dryococelus australis]|uniref:Uncharacterized protein n=1 Tax=Dryococelus australis TaxID=614101 RepID=A0ABQ9GB25_9NEOP|nr:hypothetical protein PR048_030216 [Dryococelus australis]
MDEGLAWTLIYRGFQLSLNFDFKVFPAEDGGRRRVKRVTRNQHIGNQPPEQGSSVKMEGTCEVASMHKSEDLQGLQSNLLRKWVLTITTSAWKNIDIHQSNICMLKNFTSRTSNNYKKAERRFDWKQFQETTVVGKQPEECNDKHQWPPYWQSSSGHGQQTSSCGGSHNFASTNMW